MSDLFGNHIVWFSHNVVHIMTGRAQNCYKTNEPPRGKTNNVVSEQV